jgi:hypothetical protein
MSRPQIVWPAFALITLALTVLVMACRQSNTTEPIQRTSVKALVGFYQSFPQETADNVWKNQKVRIELAAESYLVKGNDIQFFSGFPGGEPVCVMTCDMPLSDNKHALEIVGRVRGIVRDGKPRGLGVDFMVVVEQCSVMVR